jgi:SAM-dependent methyltransferase
VSQVMTAIDMSKLEQFVGKVVVDLGAIMQAPLVVLGDKLGLYRAMEELGAVTPASLAAQTGTHERYVREWLNAQAASGYVEYDAQQGTYRLTPEQAFALSKDDGPASIAGAFQLGQAVWMNLPRMLENFKSGGGLDWGQQHPCLFEGTERFFRSAYVANLIGSWIPALDGVKAKLEAGASVADVGCGLGASTILMAQAFPRSRFTGFDSHLGSIETARTRARDADVGDRVTFQVAKSTDFPGKNYDLVAFFDCLHDMQDPAGAARHARAALASKGTLMIVEPIAGDRPEDNFNPVGRILYSASTMICVPHSLAHKGPALGAQAGEARLRKVIVDEGGFSKLRRATETPFNIVLEARP